MKLNQFFDHIFCINLKSRPDRLEQAAQEAHKNGFAFQTFDAYPAKGMYFDGAANDSTKANAGCVASHRALLEIVAWNRWGRVLILEDDFQVVVPDLEAAFTDAAKELPDNWDMFYLGGSYAEDPKSRHSPRLIRTNGMMTTSSYAVTWQAARKMAPNIHGTGPIDSLYHKWNRELNCFCADPRMMIQRTGFSDIQGREMENGSSMLDPHHVARLDGLEP